MSSLHKLKAYFGMVPADEYDADYDGDDYDRDSYDRGAPERGSWDRAREDDRYERYERGAHRDSRRDEDDRDREPALVGARTSYDDDLAPSRSRTRLEPLGASAGRSGGGATSTRGALAVDPRLEQRRPEPLRHEPVRPEPLRAEPQRHEPARAEEAVEQARITTVHPTDYAEAKVVGERFRAGNPVIINLTRMSDADAKRLVDFSAGLAFAMRGSIDKVTTKVFLLSPSAVEFTDEDRRRIVENGFYNH